MVNEKKKDPICGNCGKPLSQHYKEAELYCYHNTTGDIFRDFPNEDLILNQLADKFPEEYDKLVLQWKKDNGHI